MDIKDYLQKKKDPEGYALRTILQSFNTSFEALKSFVLTRLGELETRLNSYAPIPGEKGDPGENYVITEEDYQNIANKVEVPIVEKVIEKTETVIREVPGETIREIVREMPTVTEVVREVAIPETVGKLIEKINTQEESIAISIIKGLTKRLEAIEREIRRKDKKGSGGGGGMGMPQHETFAVSSATTTVTTNYPIAFNGNGIMTANYQGSFIVRGTHYTVGGDRKTLTLLFTPENGTSIDIIYVR